MTIEKSLSVIKKRLKTAIEIGDRAGEERAYVIIYTSYWVPIERSLSIKKEFSSENCIEIGYRAGEGKAYDISTLLTSHWVTI